MRLTRSPSDHRPEGSARRKVLAGAAAVMVAVPLWFLRDDVAWLASDGQPSGAAAVADRAHGAAHTGSGAADGRVNAGAAPTAGPITELDKQLLVKVRQANLWELPAGRLAQQNAGSEPVRRAGLHLIDGHSRLDQIVREMSQALGVAIPNEPTPEQQGWIDQMKNSRGEAFDRFFANQLRNAHGKVFVVIAQVRSTTQNSVIRDLAIEANIAVSDHLQVLEDTGLVEPRTFEDVASTVVTP
jgi:predicted outer membrane protein